MPGFKRFKEKTYQKMHVGKDFVPTSNERNERMLTEATRFANSLRQCKTHVEALKKATEGMLNTTQAALSTPLPQVYDRNPHTGQTTPVARPEADGTETAHSLRNISKATTRKMEGEVIKPMALWLKNYTNLKKMMQYAENLRLDYDADRRAFNKLEMKKTVHHQGRNPNGEDTVKFTSKGATIERKFDHRDARLNGTRDAWVRYEQTVYDKLSALVRDASSLRAFLAIVLNIEEDAFSEAANVAHAVNTGTPLARSLATTPLPSRPTTPQARSEHSSPLADVPDTREQPGASPVRAHASHPTTEEIETPEKQYPTVSHEEKPYPNVAREGELPPALSPEDSALHDEFPSVPKGKPQPVHNIHANHHPQPMAA